VSGIKPFSSKPALRAQKKSSGKEEPAALFQVEVPGIRRRRRVMFNFLNLIRTVNAPSSKIILQKNKNLCKTFFEKIYPSG
jgi:hypothetical protein